MIRQHREFRATANIKITFEIEQSPIPVPISVPCTSQADGEKRKRYQREREFLQGMIEQKGISIPPRAPGSSSETIDKCTEDE